MSYKRLDNNKHKRWKDRNHYERHYCELCNVWMASDRQSILHHEQGAKHQSKARHFEIEKRKKSEREEEQQKLIQASLMHMEAAAVASIGRDYGRFTASSTTNTTSRRILPSHAPSSTAPPRKPPPIPPNDKVASKTEWNERKRQRELEKKKRNESIGNNEDDDDAADEFSKRRKVEIGENEGSYEFNGITWLEGVTFGDILEEEMPIQLWLGNPNCTEAEVRMHMNSNHWKDAIVAAVRQRPNEPRRADRIVLDVAHLHNDSEQINKSVPLRHVRIQLANTADDRIPDTLLEARLLAMGGEQVQVEPSPQQAKVQESTGFSGWSTVAIKRTTVRNEQKAERDALRRKEREAEQQAKEAEARKMEEAKVSNADDSALGAFDVWNRTKSGYKGVDIHSKPIVQVEDFAKKVADGPVAFKKIAFKAKKKKSNRRTTSADD